VLAGAGVAGRPLLVLGSGFLGGYTTFSTWMVESQRLGEEGATRLLLLNLAAPLLLGFGALAAGWAVGSAVA
jgi:CrcB protein